MPRCREGCLWARPSRLRRPCGAERAGQLMMDHMLYLNQAGVPALHVFVDGEKQCFMVP